MTARPESPQYTPGPHEMLRSMLTDDDLALRGPEILAVKEALRLNSGFWPSGSFLREDYWPYLEQCKRDGIEPMECEAYYRQTLGPHLAVQP